MGIVLVVQQVGGANGMEMLEIVHIPVDIVQMIYVTNWEIV